VSVVRRFGRWLERDDDVKEAFLAEVNAGQTESVALERVNRGFSTAHTIGTLRAWLREDHDFRKALKAARSEPPSEPRCWDLNAYADAPTGPPPPPGTPDHIAEAHGWVRLR
jgi:hypothetical protein